MYVFYLFQAWLNYFFVKIKVISASNLPAVDLSGQYLIIVFNFVGLNGFEISERSRIINTNLSL